MPRKSFPLRIDPQLFQALEEWAQQDMRSINAQIEFLLREAIAKRWRRRDKSPSPPPEQTES